MWHIVDTSINDSTYYLSHHEQFGWEVGTPKGVGERSPGERSREALWRRWYLTLAQAHPVVLCLQVYLQGLESALQLMDVTLAALHSCWAGHLLGHGGWLGGQTEERGIGIGTTWQWNLWEVWTPFLYLLFIPSVQVLMLLLYYILIFLPHILQDLDQIFSWGCIHLHTDLEVIWYMMFLHFLFNNRKKMNWLW